ncbi:GNAT family N-acetyltransferase [uncultured Lactobacillus sp.]|uniref:GNAT family N-acetyltransferase n=1 Tax=uncultured Lactobacillus sp. TaxID=153152 RepID=UPI00261CDB78|nr:GNAT family N-acetyltransferase [uncultured Lactobacillus sp.]
MADFYFKTIDEMSGREVFCVERLRCNTFVVEQKITLPELDSQDLSAIQVYQLNENKTCALATCRIFQEDGKWFLGRVAVDKDSRHLHLGSKMLERVHDYLKEKGVQNLYCHAQLSVKPFYERLGYRTSGSVFDEGGIDHIMMFKEL